MAKYPTCQATLKDGSPCRSVVKAKDGGEPWRSYCQYHGKILEAEQAADDEHGDEPTAEDTVEDAPTDEAVAGTSRVTPRDSIREFALANPHLVDEFLKGVLAATQDVWLSCPSCKKRSSVQAPNWSARTKAVELLLEQGFGRPEPAPPDDDEKLDRAIAEAFDRLSDERFLEVSGLTDFQRRLLSLPLDVQKGLSEADDAELVEVAQKRGYALTTP